jgi:starch phosphorylase
MDNIFIFGYTADEVEEIWRKGYASSHYYNRNADLKRAVDYLNIGFNGRSFEDIEKYLLFSYGVSDPYMCLADYEFYADAQKKVSKLYEDRNAWNKKSLINIANAGIFAADRSIGEYANNIWRLDAVKIDK